MLWCIFVPFVGPSDTRVSAARVPARRTRLLDRHAEAACSPCGPSALPAGHRVRSTVHQGLHRKAAGLAVRPACALALIVRHPKRLVQTYCHVVAVSFLEDLP